MERLMGSQPPPVPMDRALNDDEWATCVAWVLLWPRFNPQLDRLIAGEFLPKLLGQDSGRWGQFNARNGGGAAIHRRLAEICFRWSVLGLVVPIGDQTWALTARGRQILRDTWEERRSCWRTAVSCPGSRA